MIKVYNYEDKPVYVIADIHGEFLKLQNDIKTYCLKDCILIIAGDCGLGKFTPIKEESYINSLNKTCKELNINLLFVRGNHDNPKYFKTETLLSKSNIQCLEDYSVIEVGDKHILCVGGAVSIDRKDRKRIYQDNFEYWINLGYEEEAARAKTRPSYWKDEMPIYDEDNLNQINEMFKIDYVITHTSPSFAYKNSKIGLDYWVKRDTLLANDLEEERSVMTRIYNKLISNKNKPIKWVYGHFHGSKTEFINDVEFVALVNADFKFDAEELT